MPVIPVNPNHPAASAARKRTPSAAVRESPPRAAKARANNALMHGASASAPRCHDVASVAIASVATDAGNTAGLAAAHAVSAAVLVLAATAGSIASPVCSVNSSNSSNSKDSVMIGGGDDYDIRADGDATDEDKGGGGGIIVSYNVFKHY